MIESQAEAEVNAGALCFPTVVAVSKGGHNRLCRK